MADPRRTLRLILAAAELAACAAAVFLADWLLTAAPHP